MEEKNKKIEFFDGIWYSSRLKMKVYSKCIILCSLAVIGIAGIVLGITMAAVKLTSPDGKGGVQNPALIRLAEGTLTDAELEIPSDEGSLSYISYRIKEGDMIGFIADEFGITQDTIISVNNIHASRLIQPGQYIKVPSMPGILYTVREDGETLDTIAAKYKVDAGKIASANKIELTASLSAGKTMFVPDAELDWITRQEINGDLFLKPIKARFRISSRYGWREDPFGKSSKRTYHSGIDMACSTGTRIYAALPGKVTTAGWSDVFGNYVIVQHHSGYRSLYGHMSKIDVKKGAYVDTNTVVGRVGSTGMSTGPHLHFTVYKNGRTVNPANLWK